MPYPRQSILDTPLGSLRTQRKIKPVPKAVVEAARKKRAEDAPRVMSLLNKHQHGFRP